MFEKMYKTDKALFIRKKKNRIILHNIKHTKEYIYSGNVTFLTREKIK
jgi:hypothetical protein